jgi:hypothetical protein
MSGDVNLFWELLELSDSAPILDNDMCIIEYGEEDEFGDREFQSFWFGPKDLVVMLAKRADIEVEFV